MARDVVAKVEVGPGETGSVQLPGEYSATNPYPAFTVEKHAADNLLVETHEEQVGDRNNYRVVVRITNHNRGPAWVELVTNL